jgi:hypothetical protein
MGRKQGDFFGEGTGEESAANIELMNLQALVYRMRQEKAQGRCLASWCILQFKVYAKSLPKALCTNPCFIFHDLMVGA